MACHSATQQEECVYDETQTLPRSLPRLQAAAKPSALEVTSQSSSGVSQSTSSRVTAILPLSNATSALPKSSRHPSHLAVAPARRGSHCHLWSEGPDRSPLLRFLALPTQFILTA